MWGAIHNSFEVLFILSVVWLESICYWKIYFYWAKGKITLHTLQHTFKVSAQNVHSVWMHSPVHVTMANITWRTAELLICLMVSEIHQSSSSCVFICHSFMWAHVCYYCGLRSSECRRQFKVCHDQSFRQGTVLSDTIQCSDQNAVYTSSVMFKEEHCWIGLFRLNACHLIHILSYWTLSC
jgi:hypothetical protein